MPKRGFYNPMELSELEGHALRQTVRIRDKLSANGHYRLKHRIVCHP